MAPRVVSCPPVKAAIAQSVRGFEFAQQLTVDARVGKEARKPVSGARSEAFRHITFRFRCITQQGLDNSPEASRID